MSAKNIDLQGGFRCRNVGFRAGEARHIIDRCAEMTVNVDLMGQEWYNGTIKPKEGLRHGY